MLEKYKLPIWQTFCHISVIYCLLVFDWSNYVMACMMYFITGCFGITTFYHRYLSHRSFNTNKFFLRLGLLLGTLGGVGSSIGWVSVHRQHHRYSDESSDPHSPRYGFLRSFYGSMFHTPQVRYVTDLLRDSYQVKLHQYYWHINFIYAVILLIIGGIELWMTLHVFPSFILWTAMGAVNTLGHMWGYKNYDNVRDGSKNNWLAALLAWGEGWHNNHHGDPKNWSFQKNWWEFDPTKWVIKLIKTNNV